MQYKNNSCAVLHMQALIRTQVIIPFVSAELKLMQNKQWDDGMILCYINPSGAQLQSSVGNNALCAGGRVTFTCTVDSDNVHDWIIRNGSINQEIDTVTPVAPNAANLGFTLTVLDITAAPITSTATVSATTDLNGTVIVCNNALLGTNRLEQNATIDIIGKLITPGVNVSEGVEATFD